MPPRTVSLAVQGQRRPKSELRKPCSPSSGVRAASCFNNRHSATHTLTYTHAHTFSHTRTAVTTHSSDTEPVFFFFFRLLTPLQCEIHIIITTATPAPAPATTTTRTTELCSNAAQGQTVIVDNENYFPPTPTERFFTRFWVRAHFNGLVSHIYFCHLFSLIFISYNFPISCTVWPVRLLARLDCLPHCKIIAETRGQKIKTQPESMQHN